MPLKLKRYLNELLLLLKEDHSPQLRRIVKEAKGITCLQTLDKEKAVIRVHHGKVSIEDKAKKEEINVCVWITRECLFKILEGKTTLKEAFDNGELKVTGAPLVLVRCYGIWETIISLSRKSPRFYFLTYQLQ